MWKDVLHNMLYFMHDLLPAAINKTNWTKDDIDKAASWAAYCERAARKFQNSNMDIALSCISKQSQWVLVLHDLQNARQLLLSLLMQNQLLDASVKEHVQQVTHILLGADVLATLNKQVAQQEDFYKQVLHRMKETVDDEMQKKLEIRLILETANYSGPRQVQDCLDKMVMQPGGLSKILETVKLDDMGSAKENVNLSLQIIAWLEGVLHRPQDWRQHRRVVRDLCTLSSSLLCEILSSCPNIFKMILLILNTEVQKLEPYYCAEGCSWMPQNPATSILSYQDLVCVYASILQNKLLAAHVHVTVCDWCLEDGGSTWTDIIKDANLKKKGKVDNSLMSRKSNSDSN